MIGSFSKQQFRSFVFAARSFRALLDVLDVPPLNLIYSL